MAPCQSACGGLNCELKLSPSAVPYTRLQPHKALGYLQVVFSPEPSQNRYRPDYFWDTPWLGPLKALFWTASSVGIGLLLALLCS